MYQLFDMHTLYRRFMNAKKIVALGVLSMMVMSGCLGPVDEEFVLSKLPEDWTLKTERIIATPQLVEYDSCDLMEIDLKAAFEKKYARIMKREALQGRLGVRVTEYRPE